MGYRIRIAIPEDEQRIRELFIERLDFLSINNHQYNKRLLKEESLCLAKKMNVGTDSYLMCV